MTVKRLSGEEALTGAPAAGGTVLDFWQWAFSDLRQNSIRGVFAEWLVGQLLGLPLTVRDPWSAWDLITPQGVKVEVKCGAYLQAWHGPDAPPSSIVFGGLRNRVDSPDGRKFSELPSYNADLYVFCVQTCHDPTAWNALDVSQWCFHLLTREELVRLNVKSLTLTTLAKQAPRLSVVEFQSAAATLIAQLTAERESDPE